MKNNFWKNIWLLSSKYRVQKKIAESKKKEEKKIRTQNQKIEIGEFSILGWFDAPFPS